MVDSNQQDGPRDIPIEPDEIDNLSRFTPPDEPIYDATGRLVRLLITPKDCLPPGVSAAEIIAGQPRGTLVTLGTVAGEVHSVELKKHQWQDKLLESYWLNGYFQAVNLTTGEIFTAPCLALPKSYGLEVANAFRDPNTRRAALGVSIGLRAFTRGAVTYEWFVNNHLIPAASRVVDSLSQKITRDLVGSGAIKQLPGNFDARGHVTIAGK